jgi:phage-related minor tail protein
MEELEQKVAELTAQLQEKDGKIADMESRLKEKGGQFKKLRDMTEREKELLTEQEMKLKEEQDALADRMEAFQNEQKNLQQKTKQDRVDALALKYARGNQEVADQIKITLNNFKGFDEATVESELEPLFQNAVKIVSPGTDTTILDAHNMGGRSPQETRAEDFSLKPEGQQLASKLFGEAPKTE